MIPEGHLPGPELLRLLPRVDALAAALELAVGVEADRFERRVARRTVGEHELVAVRALLEEEPDALVLEQPGEEVVVGLVVLDDVRAPLVAPLQDVRELVPGLGGDLRGDLRHGEVLEAPRVPVPRQQPEPRHDLGPVGGEAGVAVALADARADAVEVPRAGLHRDRLPEQRAEDVRGAVHGDQVELEREELRETFLPAEAGQRQRLAER